MTLRQNAPKTQLPPHVIEAIAIIGDGSGKSHESKVEGWSTEKDEPARRGLCVQVDDNIEVIIPFAQIRRFYLYMLQNGLI